MITYIKGLIAFKSPTHVVVEAGGIGYHIHVSLNTFSKIEKPKCKILWLATTKDYNPPVDWGYRCALSRFEKSY
jgi:Holliday junction DNA helicase RuvA